MELLHEPKLWVAAAFFAFFILFGKKLYRFLVQALDARSARIAQELNEARRLREEAQALLSSYQQKQREVLAEAEEVLARARKDAQTLTEQAQAELKATLDRRMQLAVERIAQEETQAVKEVHAHVIDITVAAARSMVLDAMRNSGQEALVQQAMSELNRRLN